jgi:chromosome partition protein MukF
MPPDDPPAVSPAPVPLELTAFYQSQPALELSSLELCFLLSLQAQAEQHGLTSFREQQLLDAFERVCQGVAPDLEQKGVRATHTLRRLREQRLLTRVDGAGVARSGEYALSRLASSIADFFAEDDVLTAAGLELLANSLLASLRDVSKHARAARRAADWQAGVVAPLRITTADLILGIERRQRGLDVQQEQFQREISRLLQSDWFHAIDRCQQLLDATAATLRQLNELLLRYAHQFESLLSDILELAAQAGVPTAEAAAHRVLGQLDRVSAWGSARQQAWSEYYEHVHRYLRDVVRLDPARALTERLREQLTAHVANPFSLSVADAPPMRLLREVVPPPPPAPVKRPRGERRPKLETVSAADPLEALATQVKELCAAGPTELSRVTAAATEPLAPEQRFATAGRVAELALQQGLPSAGRVRPWVQVGDGLAIEDWALGSAPEARTAASRPEESGEHGGH